MELLTELGGLGNLGAGAVLVLVVVLIIRGKLIPESMHVRITDAKDDQIGTLKEAQKDYASQVDKLLDQGQTTHKLLRAIAPEDREPTP